MTFTDFAEVLLVALLFANNDISVHKNLVYRPNTSWKQLKM